MRPIHQRAACHTCGSWRANDISLINGLIGCTGTPVIVCSSAACPDWCSDRASSRARASALVIRAVIGRRWSSSANRPCMPALTDTASTSAGATAATHSVGPRPLRRGSCRGPARTRGQKAVAVRTLAHRDVAPRRALGERRRVHRRRADVEPDDDVGRRATAHGTLAASSSRLCSTTVETSAGSEASTGLSAPGSGRPRQGAIRRRAAQRRRRGHRQSGRRGRGDGTPKRPARGLRRSGTGPRLARRGGPGRCGWAASATRRSRSARAGTGCARWRSLPAARLGIRRAVRRAGRGGMTPPTTMPPPANGTTHRRWLRRPSCGRGSDASNEWAPLSSHSLRGPYRAMSTVNVAPVSSPRGRPALNDPDSTHSWNRSVTTGH